MHCRSCELLVEDELLKIPGVTHAAVNHAQGVAEVSFRDHLYKQAVAKAIAKAGYTLGRDRKIFVSTNPGDYKELGAATLIAVSLYLIAQNLGLFSLSNSVSGNYSNLPVVFIVGLTAGISTCMALIGGLVLGASARFSAAHPQATGLDKFKPHLFFNLGRVVSYTLLGGLIGLLGSFFQLSTSTLGILIIAAGLVMLLLGGQLIDIFPFLKSISFTIPKFLSRKLGLNSPADTGYSHTNSLVSGALTFFLPCGFTQAMQLYAMSTGSAAAGAATMGVFALGTAPGLLGVGGLTSVVKGGFARLFFKTAGVVVIFLAVFNLTNGFNLLGINPTSFAFRANAASGIADPNVKVINGIQEVRMTQTAGGYLPNSFTIRAGIPVKWLITSRDVYTCAASIVSAQLGIRQGLQLGENVIEFTPKESGTIRFSCAMGMYTGVFNVVAADGRTASTVTVPVKPASPVSAPACGAQGGGCGCGSAGRPAQAKPIVTGDVIQAGSVQLIKATYTQVDDIVPNQFTVSAGTPVRFEIEAKDNGAGCMGSVTLPGLVSSAQLFTAGQTVTFTFTPNQPGSFNITCGMGIPRGRILVQ